jgi:hypothetical protein
METAKKLNFKVLVNISTVSSAINKEESAYAIFMYKYLTRIKEKHRGVTNEFHVNPENHM